MGEKTIITIESFDPLRIVWPDVDAFTGPIEIQLPPNQIKVLGFGAIMPTASLRSKASIVNLTFDLGDGVVETGKMFELIKAIKPHLIEAWQVAEDQFLQKPLLGNIW